jgi:hypothetical protein
LSILHLLRDKHANGLSFSRFVNLFT